MKRETEDIMHDILQNSNIKGCREKIRRLEEQLIQSFNKKELELFLEYERLVNEELYEIMLELLRMREENLE